MVWAATHRHGVFIRYVRCSLGFVPGHLGQKILGAPPVILTSDLISRPRPAGAWRLAALYCVLCQVFFKSCVQLRISSFQFPEKRARLTRAGALPVVSPPDIHLNQFPVSRRHRSAASRLGGAAKVCALWAPFTHPSQVSTVRHRQPAASKSCTQCDGAPSSASIAVFTADTSCDASASQRGPSRRHRSSSRWRAAFAQIRSECSRSFKIGRAHV